MSSATKLISLTLGEAEDRYHEGRMSQVEYEAYRRAWADAGGTRCGYSGAVGWSIPSADPDVETLASELVALAAKRNRRV